MDLIVASNSFFKANSSFGTDYSIKPYIFIHQYFTRCLKGTAGRCREYAGGLFTWKILLSLPLTMLLKLSALSPSVLLTETGK